MPYRRGSFPLFLTQLIFSFGTVAGAIALREEMPRIAERVNDYLENFNGSPRPLKRRQPEYFPE